MITRARCLIGMGVVAALLVVPSFSYGDIPAISFEAGPVGSTMTMMPMKKRASLAGGLLPRRTVNLKLKSIYWMGSPRKPIRS